MTNIILPLGRCLAIFRISSIAKLNEVEFWPTYHWSICQAAQQIHTRSHNPDFQFTVFLLGFSFLCFIKSFGCGLHTQILVYIYYQYVLLNNCSYLQAARKYKYVYHTGCHLISLHASPIQLPLSPTHPCS